jgi:hypothetical protein
LCFAGDGCGTRVAPVATSRGSSVPRAAAKALLSQRRAAECSVETPAKLNNSSIVASSKNSVGISGSNAISETRRDRLRCHPGLRFYTTGPAHKMKALMLDPLCASLCVPALLHIRVPPESRLESLVPSSVVSGRGSESKSLALSIRN